MALFEKEIKGILVFCSIATLKHKLKDGKRSEGCYCYWSTKRPPKTSVNRIYIVVKGKVQGYFKISSITQSEIRFHSEDWNPIENGRNFRPSQGWRYYKE